MSSPLASATLFVFDLIASHSLQRHTLISMYDQYHLHHRFPTSMVFLLFDLWCSRRSLSLSTVLVDTLSLSRSSWYVPLSLSSSSLSFARRSCTKNRQCCEISDGAMEPEIQGIDRVASGLHLHPPALLLSLPEPVLGGFHLLPVSFPLLLPALLLVPVLRLELVKTGQLFSLQGQSPLLLLLQEHVPPVAAGQGGPLRQGRPLQLNVTVLLRYDGLVTPRWTQEEKSSKQWKHILIFDRGQTPNNQFVEIFRGSMNNWGGAALPADCRAFGKASALCQRTRSETWIRLSESINHKHLQNNTRIHGLSKLLLVILFSSAGTAMNITSCSVL